MFDKAHIVTCISNPVRYKSRPRIYNQWAGEVEKSGFPLTTVECAYGDRPFEVTERDNPKHVQLRSFDELWHKENMLNIGIANILQRHPDAEYFLWVDADVFPTVPMREWFEECVHQLQHYHFVQMFEYAQWLDPDNGPDGGPGRGIIANYYQAGFLPPMRGGSFGTYSQHSRSGLAWGARKEALDFVGGLIDFAILGSADWYMAFGMLHSMDEALPKGLSDDYKQELYQWQARCKRYIRKDVGYMKGMVNHRFHGAIVDRQYYDRNEIIIKNNFRPNYDLKRDTYGLWQWETEEDNQILMRDLTRMYFRQRNEDSIYMPPRNELNQLNLKGKSK